MKEGGGREGEGGGRREEGEGGRGGVKRNTVEAEMERCPHIQLSEVAQCKSQTCLSSFKTSSLFYSFTKMSQ